MGFLWGLSFSLCLRGIIQQSINYRNQFKR